MAAANYSVSVRDVDGRSVRRFASLDKAVARFEEMAGMSAEAALREMYWRADAEGRRVPGVSEVQRIFAVSMFGAAVALEAISDAAIASAEDARMKAEAEAEGDWCAVVEMPAYDERDGLCGSRRVAISSHADEAGASAALGALGEDDMDPDCRYYVARKSEGLRRPAPTLAYDDGSNDIPF